MGDLHHIVGKFNAVKYVDMLENVFLPSLTALNHPFPPGQLYFMHDLSGPPGAYCKTVVQGAP